MIKPYYEEENITIYNGDCLEVMKEFDNESIDCVIADPPYGLNYLSNRYKYGNPHLKIENDDKLFIPIVSLWQKLKTTGAMYVFYSHKLPLVSDNIKNVIIWVKNNWSAGDLEGDYGNQYEMLAFMPKGNFKLKSKRFSNVWFFDREIPKYHPTQKPTSLINRIIESATNKGDIILDPFLGSGTTARACKDLGRKCIGIEISKEYCDIAVKRLGQEVFDLAEVNR